MGFEASTCSLTRFRVVDAVPQALWSGLESRLKQFAFLSIDDMPEMSASKSRTWKTPCGCWTASTASFWRSA